MTSRRGLLVRGASVLAGGAAGPARAAGAYEDATEATWRHAGSPPADDAALQRELVRYATLAPNGHNTQPWRFRRRPGAIELLPDLSRRTPVVDADDHHLWVSLGCAVENLSLAAAAFGRHATAAVAEGGAGSVRILLERTAALRSPLFEAIPRRRSTRAEYAGGALGPGELKLLEAAATSPEIDVLLLADAKRLAQVRDAVVAGNTAQMADAAFVAELKSWIRFSRAEALERRDGLFAGASGSPVLPHWLGARMFDLFFTAERENDKYARQLRSSAGVAVFSAAGAGPAAWFAVGRSCERFLLQAAALDIRTAFVNQPAEVPALRASFASGLGLGGRRPSLVVRFGRGPRMVPSLRRAVAAVSG